MTDSDDDSVTQTHETRTRVDVYGLLYLLLAPGLTFVNVEWIHPRDRALGWVPTTMLWGLLYLPLMIAGGSIAERMEIEPGIHRKMLGFFLLIILAAMQITMWLDLRWPALLLQWVAIPLIFRFTANLVRVGDATSG
jgi:hypothetical protein